MTESHQPQNPYAVSKAACDLLWASADAPRAPDRPRAGVQPGGTGAVGRVRGRHDHAAGRGEEATGGGEAVIRTGNPDSARDFTDVRD